MCKMLNAKEDVLKLKKKMPSNTCLFIMHNYPVPTLTGHFISYMHFQV